MENFIILSIDGGGVRGIVPAMILKAIENELGKNTHEIFDLFSGTSTGALLAIGVVASNHGYDPSNSLDHIIDVYKKRTIEIFPKTGSLGKLLKLFRPEFSPDGMRNVLNDMLGTMSMSNCIKPVIVVSYDLNSNKPYFFKSRYVVEHGSNPGLVDVCMSSTAAPTYFPPYSLELNGKKLECVDGGVFMNNPSLTPLFEISKHHRYYGLDDAEADNIFLLSLGTGSVNKKPLKASKWGTLKWIRPVIDLSMRGSEEAVDYGAGELLKKGHYMRIDLDIPEEHAEMSDASPQNIEFLINRTQKYLDSKEFKKLIAFLTQAMDL